MAQHKSAAKRARQTKRITVGTSARRTEVRSAVKAVQKALAGKDLKKAKEALAIAIPKIDRAAQKGTIPSGRAQRQISRLTKAVNKVGA